MPWAHRGSCPPSHSCLGYDPSLTLHQVLAMVTLPFALEQPGWAGNSYQPMAFDGERVKVGAPFLDGSKPGCCCFALTWI